MLYKSAITRKPGENFSEGITTANLGKPDYKRAVRQQQMYIDTLISCGLDVMDLEPDLRFPDGYFVEDTAVITSEMAIMTNPGAASRNGETKSIAEVIKPLRKLFFIQSPGTLEGGDVMKADKHFFIGLSGRTNEEGIRQFDEIARQFGYTTSAVPLYDILHLKSGIAYIGNKKMVAIREMAGRKEFKAFEMIELEPEENYAANCLRIDVNKLIIPKGYIKIKETLGRLGYEITELEVTEFQKMDGGLTCLSLLF